MLIYRSVKKYLHSKLPQTTKIRFINKEIDNPITKMLELEISPFFGKFSVKIKQLVHIVVLNYMKKKLHLKKKMIYWYKIINKKLKESIFIVTCSIWGLSIFYILLVLPFFCKLHAIKYVSNSLQLNCQAKNF